MKDIAIVLAGGNGERFGSRKQFINFMGKPLYLHVYDKLLEILPKENIVVVGIDIPGGETRSKSVQNGLEYFKEKSIKYNKVVICEAARPLVTTNQIETLLNCKEKSATFALPLVNTIIKRDGTYQNREEFYDLLTPQAFDFELLYSAYKGKDLNLTDETRLMFETYGIKPHFILDGQNLVKLTYMRDLPYLKYLFELQKEQNEEAKSNNYRRLGRYSTSNIKRTGTKSYIYNINSLQTRA